GTDVNSGALRYTFGFDELQEGIDFVALSMGIYGFAEIMSNLEQNERRTLIPGKVGAKAAISSVATHPAKKDPSAAIP
uniref:tripartite tricarboxylate transporter permease n=1 Tax=Vibrio cholerae TaxID=666 RepID=UPI001C11B252